MSTTLSTKSFVSLHEYQVFRGIDDDNQAEQYIVYLNAAAGYCESYCNRLFSGSAVEEFSGWYYNNVNDIYHDTHQSKFFPFLSVPLLEYRDGTVWKAVTEAHSYNSVKGTVYYTNAMYFCEGTNNYRISVDYGYTPTTAPTDLKAAQMMIARSFEMESVSGGVSITTDQMGSKTYTSNGPSKFVTRILDKYKVR